MTFNEYLRSINKAALSPAMVPHYKELKACWEAAQKAAREESKQHAAHREHASNQPAGKRGLSAAHDQENKIPDTAR